MSKLLELITQHDLQNGFLYLEEPFAIHFHLETWAATCDVCPLTIPEFFRGSTDVRLLATHSLNRTSSNKKEVILTALFQAPS